MKKAKLLWVDLEMTGLEPEKDRILEVAAIATDMKLNEVARYEAVVKVDEKIIKSNVTTDEALRVLDDPAEYVQKIQAIRFAHYEEHSLLRAVGPPIVLICYLRACSNLAFSSAV